LLLLLLFLLLLLEESRGRLTRRTPRPDGTGIVGCRLDVTLVLGADASRGSSSSSTKEQY